MAENGIPGERERPQESNPAGVAPPESGDASPEQAVERVEAILEPLEPLERKEVIEQVMFHQGPLPPAELLREYDVIVPGLAREIADGVAEERRFRHRMTERTGWQEFILNFAGLLAILIALAMMLAIVAYMVSVEKAEAGAFLGCGIIVAVVVALSNYRKRDATPMPPVKQDKPPVADNPSLD